MSNTRTEKIKFENSSGFLIDARLDTPIDTPNACAIFCHCFTCTKETITTFRLCRLLAQHGIACLRFDFTGLGNSEGDFANSNFTTMVDDVIAAANYLTEHHNAPAYLFGHSMGGTAVLAASLQIESTKGIITIASPSKPDHVLHHFGGALTLLEQNQAASFNVAGQMHPMNPQFLNDVRSYDSKTLFAEINKPVLIFNVQHDEMVSPKDAEEINQWVSGQSKVITLDKANHLLTDRNDTTKVVDETLNWIKTLP